jgi:8-amino-7-oxononanoate synthase
VPLSNLSADLELLQQQGLLRQRRVLESAQGAHVTVDGRDCLSFCSNDYLGLANHPALIAAAQQGAAQYGVGSGASHLVTGHSIAHHALETQLAQFVGLPAALLFSTGYMANIGVITALLGRGDAVFADKLNHASLNDAALLSRAEFKRYPHLDMAALEKLLAASKAKRKLVVTDAVFSMDGDLAPVPELLGLCERHDAYLMLDDAHGFGVLGAQGRGILEHFGVASPRIVYMATLGKAAGVSGAFVAGSEALIQTLIQRARSYIYTTATPPLLAVALSVSLKLICEEGHRRQHLAGLIEQLRGALQLRRWHLLPSETPIQPVVIGGNAETVKVSEALLQRGILVPAIRPPTVPKGQARLRISLSAAHSAQDVARLAAALLELEAQA